MTEATDTLREAAERLPDRRSAVRAASALSRVAVRPGRVLNYDDGERPHFDMVEADTRDAAPLLDKAYGDLEKAAETLGHIRVTQQVEKTADGLAEASDRRRASALAGRLASTLERRKVVSRARERSQRSQELTLHDQGVPKQLWRLGGRLNHES